MSSSTIYKGCKFKSELTARWAVFFDTLGVKWKYKPDEIAVGGGVTYTPDFIIYDVVPRYAQGDTKENLYVAVIDTPNAVDALKIKLFSEKHHIWVVGELPDPTLYVDSCEQQRDKFCRIVREHRDDPAYVDFCVLCPYDHGTIDGDTCFEFSLGFDYNTLSFHGADSNYDYGHHYTEIEQALRKARSAEFEYMNSADSNSDDKYVKKLVTMVVEVDVPSYVSDDSIRHEIEQEISCASVFRDIKSFYISDPLESNDEENSYGI